MLSHVVEESAGLLSLSRPRRSLFGTAAQSCRCAGAKLGTKTA